MYTYALLAPRGDNDVHLSGPTLGIEVTIPALAARCSLGNIDPQHSGQDATTAAIEAALTWPLPAPGSTLATVRADADSVGAMAVLLLRAAGHSFLPYQLDRIAQVATADKEASGPWPGVRPAPEPEDLVGPATAVMHMAADHTRPLTERVGVFADWLRADDIAQGVILGYAERAHLEAQHALSSLQVDVQGPIAVVVGSHRLAMSIGYRYAPVVVATNPDFSFSGGPAHRKHTVARWNTRALPGISWPSLIDALNDADPAATADAGWGGSTSIIGSPMGIGSGLDTAQVVEIVRAVLAEGLQRAAWDLGEYADYYAALRASGEPVDESDAAKVKADQQRVSAAIAGLEASENA